MDTPTKKGIEDVHTRIGAVRAELCSYITKLEARVAELEKKDAPKAS